MDLTGVLGFLVGTATALLACGVVTWRRRRALEALDRDLTALEEGRPVRAIPSVVVGGSLGRLIRRFHELLPRIEEQLTALEGEHQQLRAVLGGMVEGVLAIDARRRLLFANPAAVRLFGFHGAAIGRPIAETIRSLPILEAVEAAVTGPGAYHREVVVPVAPRDLTGPQHGSSHTERVLALRGAPLPGSPSAGILLVVHDVTELRRLERTRQDFVANASHELKTPLASIKAYTETLLDWGLDDPQQNVKFLRQIDEQADRLNLLILDLLSLARLDSGAEAFDHRPMALGPAVQRTAEVHRPRAESQGLALQLDLKRLDDSVIIQADEEAIRQILDNLIDNAIKYTAKGGQVRLSGRVEGGEAVLEVADTGVGIPRDELSRIFERFYRVDKARSRELGGTGLGLAIVKHLVQSLGGGVGVTSRLGSGSVFTVRLPCHQPATRGRR